MQTISRTIAVATYILPSPQYCWYQPIRSELAFPKGAPLFGLRQICLHRNPKVQFIDLKLLYQAYHNRKRATTTEREYHNRKRATTTERELPQQEESYHNRKRATTTERELPQQEESYHNRKRAREIYISITCEMGRPHGLTFTWWGCCSVCL